MAWRTRAPVVTSAAQWSWSNVCGNPTPAACSRPTSPPRQALNERVVQRWSIGHRPRPASHRPSVLPLLLPSMNALCDRQMVPDANSVGNGAIASATWTSAACSHPGQQPGAAGDPGAGGEARRPAARSLAAPSKRRSVPALPGTGAIGGGIGVVAVARGTPRAGVPARAVDSGARRRLRAGRRGRLGGRGVRGRGAAGGCSTRRCRRRPGVSAAGASARTSDVMSASASTTGAQDSSSRSSPRVPAMLPSAAINRSSADQRRGRAGCRWIAIESRRFHRLAASAGGLAQLCGDLRPRTPRCSAHDSAPGPRVQSSHSVVGSPNGGCRTRGRLAAVRHALC